MALVFWWRVWLFSSPPSFCFCYNKWTKKGQKREKTSIWRTGKDMRTCKFQKKLVRGGSNIICNVSPQMQSCKQRLYLEMTVMSERCKLTTWPYAADMHCLSIPEGNSLLMTWVKRHFPPKWSIWWILGSLLSVVLQWCHYKQYFIRSIALEYGQWLNGHNGSWLSLATAKDDHIQSRTISAAISCMTLRMYFSQSVQNYTNLGLKHDFLFFKVPSSPGLYVI